MKKTFWIKFTTLGQRKNSNYCTGERETFTNLSNLFVYSAQSHCVNNQQMDIWHLFISFVSLWFFFSFCSESVLFPQVFAEMGKTLTLPWTPGREFGTQNSSGVWWAAFSSNPPEKMCVCKCCVQKYNSSLTCQGWVNCKKFFFYWQCNIFQ